MALPLLDWQFWAVTVAAVGAVWTLLRPFFGAGGAGGAGLRKAGDPCSLCRAASGAPCRSRGGRVVAGHFGAPR
jgi:hypothetical protein